MRALFSLAIVLGLVVCAAHPAFGESTGPMTIAGTFDVELMRPASGAYSLVVTERPRIMPTMDFSLGVVTGLSSRPLKACSDPTCSASSGFGAIISQRGTAWLVGALSLKYVEVGLAAPFSFINESQINPKQGGQSIAGGPGDVRLVAKLPLLGNASKVGVGLVAAASLPTGNPGNFLGGPGFGAEGWALTDVVLGPVIVAASGGYRWRSKQGVTQNLAVRNAFVFAGGAAVGLFKDRLALVGEAHGEVAVGDSVSPQRPLEVLGALRFLPTSSTLFLLGGGKGVFAGLGSPDWRAFASITYQRTNIDRDEDGIPDESDACAKEAEDPDGFEDSDGCPDLDNDEDGVADTADDCPNRSEDRDGFKDSDGCPDLDNDEDGVPDTTDKCVLLAEDVNGFDDADGCPEADDDHDGVVDDKCLNEPEDMDGFEDADGCPDPDNDKDSIADPRDQCPLAAEDVDQFEDDDGCPDDNDRDWFPDATDKCPTKPETINGTDDTDGCPDSGKSLVEFKADRIALKDSLGFERKKAELKKESFELLDHVVWAMKAHGDLKLRVEVRTDERGSDEFNLDLSRQRAEAIVAYLALNGVSPDRLDAKGFGRQPAPDTSSATGKKRSRSGRDAKKRVDFLIVSPSTAR